MISNPRIDCLSNMKISGANNAKVASYPRSDHSITFFFLLLFSISREVLMFSGPALAVPCFRDTKLSLAITAPSYQVEKLKCAFKMFSI